LILIFWLLEELLFVASHTPDWRKELNKISERFSSPHRAFQEYMLPMRLAVTVISILVRLILIGQINTNWLIGINWRGDRNNLLYWQKSQSSFMQATNDRFLAIPLFGIHVSGGVYSNIHYYLFNKSYYNNTIKF
jgi:hypothetical protein